MAKVKKNSKSSKIKKRKKPSIYDTIASNIIIRIEGETKNFSDKQKLRVFINAKLTLKKC